MGSSKVITCGDFALNACQAVAFTPDEEVSPVKLIQGFLPRWAQRFDAEPLALPVSEVLIKETPRVILEDKKGNWRCHIASSRVDLFWRKKTPGNGDVTLAVFVDETANFLVDYRDFMNARVSRLSAVVSRHAPCENPGLFLSRYFCKPEITRGPLNRPESFELHARKSYILAGKFSINSWVRSKTGILPQESGRPTVLVEQDLNTLAEDAASAAFEEADIRSFFSAAGRELESILSIYYPPS